MNLDSYILHTGHAHLIALAIGLIAAVAVIRFIIINLVSLIAIGVSIFAAWHLFGLH